MQLRDVDRGWDWQNVEQVSCGCGPSPSSVCSLAATAVMVMGLGVPSPPSYCQRKICILPTAAIQIVEPETPSQITPPEPITYAIKEDETLGLGKVSKGLLPES